MSNSNHQNEKETEARIHEILIAFAKDFQEFIRNKPRAGKDAYKIVDIPQGILQILNRLYSSHAPQEWFLSGNADKPVEPRCYRKSLRSYLRRAGVPTVNPHALRHTFATTCLQAGCNVKTLSELLGHAGSDITMKRYVHTCWDWKRTEMERIFP